MSDACDAQVYAWAELYSSQPSSPSVAPSSASSGVVSSYAPSDFAGSPSGTTNSLFSSPRPSRRRTTVPIVQYQPQVASWINYAAFIDHLPALDAAYQDNPEAENVLQAIRDLIFNAIQPDNSLINALIVRDALEYRCSVNTCPRYIQGSGWSRLDRARDHFRNDHLGIYSPCTFPGCDATASRTRFNPPAASEIDYAALSEHLPTLYAVFDYSIDATQALEEVIQLVMQKMQPSDSIINRLVLHDVDECRCAVSTCERHIKGSGWKRLDRARGHFRTEHLGSYFPCSVLGCDVRCRRLSDLRAHQKSHRKRPPRFYCGYCHRSYAKRSNLNRHIEIGHRMRAPRRIRRQTARR